MMICTGCGTAAPALEPRPFRCPNSGKDDVDHVLRRSIDLGASKDELRTAFLDPEPNPFVRYRRLTHTWSTAMAMGMTDDDYVKLVGGLEPQFRVTPLLRRDELWIKDETSNVAGSHKGRHLMGLRIWMEVMKLTESWLAIASCGNAALAAATIAQASGLNLDVFVPSDASPPVIERIEQLGAHVTRCPRRRGVKGDPSVQRFREAVAAGALPFTCQGNENGMVIEGGQTIGWEMVSQLLTAGETVDRLFVQVGGGALASACVAAFDDAFALGMIPRRPRIHAVQTKASPLARAWEKLKTSGRTLDYAIHHRSEFMTPWETPPSSVAGGILDDETYDWAAIVRGMIESDGFPIVVSEEQLIEANRIGRSYGIPVDATGSAGLAGVLELKQQEAIRPSESLGVLFTGRSR